MLAVARATAVLCALIGCAGAARSGTSDSFTPSERAHRLLSVHVMSTFARSQARRFAAACLASSVVPLLLAACASSPQLGPEWVDPQLGTRSNLLRSARVLVACEAHDRAVRQVCQDRLAAEVVARGATPVFASSDTPLAPDRAVDGQLLPAARHLDAAAVLVVTLVPAVTDVSPGFSVGIGGFGFGRSSGMGVGVAAPIGGGQVTTGFSANGRATVVATGKLAWTASVVAQPSADLSAQLGALCKALLDSAESKGIF